MKHKKHSKAANKTAPKRELQTSLFIFSRVLLFTQKQQRVRKECKLHKHTTMCYQRGADACQCFLAGSDLYH